MSFLPTTFVYNVKEVSRIIDGDTVDLILDLGFNILTKKRIRLWGINTPEIRTRDAQEKIRGYAAKQRLEELIELDVDRDLILHSKGLGKYGRVLGEIYNGDQNVNQLLITEGHAERYD